MKHLMLAMILCAGLACTRKDCTRKAEQVMIMKVGGCDRGGFCGVMLNDRTTDRLRYPVEGQIINKCN